MKTPSTGEKVKMKNKKKYVFELLKMSWEKPIELEILTFCNQMARQMRSAESAHRETGWFANNSISEQCGAMAKAYETVAKHVEGEIKFRESIND